nr:septum formation initiator family protein [uncultured Leptotrichia sp.]
MKKLRIIGNIVFFSLVVYFIGQSVRVFLNKKSMQNNLISTDKEIKELNDRKNKLLRQEKNSDEDEKTEKFARNNLNLKKEGEETYKISE